ncbi:MAG: plastocyanin/azurin family copper-binding protein [Actinomycetota bacterium]
MRSHAIKIGVVAAVASATLWGGSGIASAGGGCHASGMTTGRGTTVDLSDMCFDSTVLYVERGADVTWTNRDAMAHVVVGVADSWGDPGLTLYEGDTVSYRFDDDGVYPYACWIHPGMIGAIVVGDGVGSDLGAVVPVAEAGDAPSTQGVSAGAVQDGNVDATVIWVAGAVLLMAGLGGGFAIAARSRRKGVLAG